METTISWVVGYVIGLAVGLAIGKRKCQPATEQEKKRYKIFIAMGIIILAIGVAFYFLY